MRVQTDDECCVGQDSPVECGRVPCQDAGFLHLVLRRLRDGDLEGKGTIIKHEGDEGGEWECADEDGIKWFRVRLIEA